MTQDYRSAESILAIDCGSTSTQAMLIDSVGGDYRLVARAEAPSTTEPPWNDVVSSVRMALDQLTEITGWRFLDERGQLITPQDQNGGVDAVVAITSAGEPLKLLLAGIMRDVSLDSARHATSTTYSLVEGHVSLGGREGDLSNSDADSQIRLIQEQRPDVVVLAGGIDGGASGPVLQSGEAIALACSTLPNAERPVVIYAGNAELRQQIAELMGAETEVRAVDNVRPSMEQENPGPLQAEIETLYYQKKMERLPGYGTLANWSPVPVVPAARAFAHTIQYLAALDEMNVLGLNAGGASTTVAAVVDKQFDMTIRSDLGLSHNISHILDLVPTEYIQRWLPFEIEAGEIRNTLINKTLRHRTVPQTKQDLLLEQAVAREIIRVTTGSISSHWRAGPSSSDGELLPKFHLIVGGGGVLTHAPSFGQAALILLDALQPVGVTGMALDGIGLAAPLGAVAMVNPIAAAQVMERDALVKLGTVVAPIGSGREGETALEFRIDYDDERALEVEVSYGSLEVIPLPLGTTATLELRPTRRFDVGLGTKGQAATTRVEGGIIGIIIDARGRPLPISEELEEQQSRMQRWLWDVGS
jgi:hypothetical protein